MARALRGGDRAVALLDHARQELLDEGRQRVEHQRQNVCALRRRGGVRRVEVAHRRRRPASTTW